MSCKRVGVYIDSENISRSGAYRIRYEVLRRFACRDNYEPIRLNTYIAVDRERYREDSTYRHKMEGYFSYIRDTEFKIIEKDVKWITTSDGSRYGKANADLDMAVDMLLQSEKVDRILLLTGDGDFVQVVRALQNKGCRVELVGFNNLARELRKECDSFISGFMIPDLIPFEEKARWEHIGSQYPSVRGVCSFINVEENYGFIQYLKAIGDLSVKDSRLKESPYSRAYFKVDTLPPTIDSKSLPSRDIVLEFRIEKPQGKDKIFPIAKDITLCCKI